MLRVIGVVSMVGVLTVAQGGVCVAQAAEAPGGLRGDLDRVLRDSRLRNASVGVVVRDVRSGRTLYRRGAGRLLKPASNNKIQTTAAAFGLLGADYRFRTRVYEAGGRLYLKGTGDTTMRVQEYRWLAEQVAKAGGGSVDGLVADDTWFDRKRIPSDWYKADLQYHYGSETSALTVAPDPMLNAGAVRVTVTPGERGQRVGVRLTPRTSVLKIRNRAVTGRPGSGRTLSVERRPGNVLVVRGSLPARGLGVQVLRSVEDPALYAADVFRRALRRNGVRVPGGPLRHGTTPRGARLVATRTSMPLSQLAVPLMKLSNNVMSETLIKAIGRKVRGRGSWEAGLPAAMGYLRRLGVRVRMTDGSGLSHGNRTSAAQLAVLLRNARREPWFRAWRNSFPVAGRPGLEGGTLAHRMRGTAAAGNVQAKTGTISGVTALSGYVTDSRGRKLLFSIVINGHSGGKPSDIEDRIAIRLASGRDVRLAPRNDGDLERSWREAPPRLLSREG